MTGSEMNLLNYNEVRKTEQNYWLFSAAYFSEGASNTDINTSGMVYSAKVNNAYGVRPAITLIPNIEYYDGDGSMANPYIIN